MPGQPHIWHFQFSKQAYAMMETMTSGHRKAVFRCLEAIIKTENPVPGNPDCVAGLKGRLFTGVLKYRVGDYRILFMLDETPITILAQSKTYKGTVKIFRINTRDDVYRKF